MEIWGAWKGKMEGKWKSEKWKFLMQGNYIKKARSCEQALIVVCGKVAILMLFKFKKPLYDRDIIYFK